MSYEAQLRQLARVLSEIAHTLESVDHSSERVERAMALVQQIVPYRRCAVLEVRHDGEQALYVLPSPDEDERARVAERMARVFKLVAHGDQIGRSADAVPSLSLPLIGLDSTIGVIRVEPSETVYDATHLRVLSVVAAQLGAYLTTLHLRERDREREARIAAAHDFQQLLTGIVSHDLRNPLAVITAVASSLLERTPDAKHAESLRRALRNAEHAARLISDLADITEARVSGSLSLAPKRGALAHLVDTIIGDLRSAHPHSTIELFCDVRPDDEVAWDVERITQVITNLVNNALAHGAVGLPVRVAVWSEADAVVLSVHNYGPPIPSELMPSIFDPFKHGERPRSRTARGLGLGLFIVDQIIRSHGGSVAVTSDELSGTTFKMRIPRTCTVAHAAPRPTAPDEKPVVMVVDDDEAVRIGMTGILEKRGFTVIAACDGHEALESLKSGARPRVILLDLSMPRMNGEELCERLQEDPALATIPVVVISSDTAAALRLSRERAKAFLAKPVSLDQLLATIDTIH